MRKKTKKREREKERKRELTCILKTTTLERGQGMMDASPSRNLSNIDDRKARLVTELSRSVTECASMDSVTRLTDRKHRATASLMPSLIDTSSSALVGTFVFNDGDSLNSPLDSFR